MFMLLASLFPDSLPLRILIPSLRSLAPAPVRTVLPTVSLTNLRSLTRRRSRKKKKTLALAILSGQPRTAPEWAACQIGARNQPHLRGDCRIWSLTSHVYYLSFRDPTPSPSPYIAPSPSGQLPLPSPSGLLPGGLPSPWITYAFSE